MIASGGVSLGFDKEIHQDHGETEEIRPRHGILPPADRRLGGEGSALGSSLASHLQGGIIPQRVRIIGILIPAGDLEHPLAQEFFHRVSDVARMSPVADDLRHSLGQPDPPVDFSEKEDSRVRGHFAPLEVRLDFFASQVFKQKPLFAMIFHGCFAPSVGNGFFGETIINQHVEEETAFFMHNSG